MLRLRLSCAPPAQVQIGGFRDYVVNQGPVYSGPGFYTAPTYEGEALTVDYPYVGYGHYPRYGRPYDGGTYADTFRHRPYWARSQFRAARHHDDEWRASGIAQPRNFRDRPDLY